MPVQIALHVPPHVGKYIRNHVGNNSMRVARGNLFYVFLIGILEKTETPVIPSRKPNLVIHIAERDCHKRDYDLRKSFPLITDRNQDHFSFLVEEVMRKELFSRLDLLIERGEASRRSGKIKTEINNFQTRYGIDESEWSYDTIKKAYYRYRKALVNNTLVD